MTKRVDTLADLTPDARNANRGTERGRAMLETSLRKYGAGRSVLADKHGALIAGNKTVEVAADLGIPIRTIETDGRELVVVQRTDLDLAAGGAARELAYADNRVGQVSLEWELAQIGADVEAGVDLSALWSEDELAALLAGARGPTEGLTDPDAVPGVPVEPITRPGDLWALGRHRLLCGDCTDAHMLDRLVSQAPQMILTDPPYGMHLDTDFSTIKGALGSIGRTQGTQGKRYEAVIGDDEDYDPQFLMAHFATVREQFWFGADYYAERIPNRGAGSWLCWDKRKESQSDAIGAEFELCWSKQKHKRRMLRHDWFGFLSSANGSDARNRVHPTQKPVSLFADIMQQWGDTADIVLDFYGGSGSTLIAAEQTGRTAYLMEIDPTYCDVIVARWEAFTGGKAVRDGQ